MTSQSLSRKKINDESDTQNLQAKKTKVLQMSPLEHCGS